MNAAVVVFWVLVFHPAHSAPMEMPTAYPNEQACESHAKKINKLRIRNKLRPMGWTCEEVGDG